MRAVVQRVTEADVTVEGQVTGKIDKGLMVLLGVEEGDTDNDACLLYTSGQVIPLKRLPKVVTSHMIQMPLLPVESVFI